MKDMEVLNIVIKRHEYKNYKKFRLTFPAAIKDNAN